MSVAERILNKLNTPEGQETLNKWVEKYKVQQEAENIKIQAIFSNNNYINWLESFTVEHQSFSDDDWLYCPEIISQEDRENVTNLRLFYEGIERYAKDNYIYPPECDYGGYYNIKFENCGYEIGMLEGQGTIVFFCNRKEFNKDLEYIEFEDIASNKKRNTTDIIAQQLEDLSNAVLELYKNGVPLDALVETLDTTLLGIKKEENNHIKTLKK